MRPNVAFNPKTPQNAAGIRIVGESTKTLRGLAVLFLILGHFSNQVADSFLPLYWAAAWAVIIFLFASGIGLTKKYGLSKLSAGFWKNRIKRLMFPVL
jgi:peptidoglycan/LPS O-acetylase OafA/YrhL